VACEGDQHRVLDIVVQCIAVADAFQRDAGDRRDQLDQAGFSGAVPPLHVAREKSAEGVGRELRDGYHDRFPLSARLRRQPNSVACIYLGCVTARAAPALRWPRGQPDGSRIRSVISGFFQTSDAHTARR
jgi:hypothetical protein